MKMEKKTRRRQFIANKLHGELFVLVFISALVPTIITTVSLFFLIFHITAEQIGIPEAIIYSIIPAAQKVIFILVTILPIAILIMLAVAYFVTHKIVGPFDRVVRELNDCICGKKKTPIVLRRNDRFWPLVDKINTLLDRANK